MTVPGELLARPLRDDVVSFYSEVFGWRELASETIDGRRLVLGAYSVDQFVFLTSGDEPMRAPRLDHFGLGVATEDELDELYARALAYGEHDSRVEVVPKQTEQHPGVSITSFYVGFLLPLMVEVQHFSFDTAH